MTKKQSLHLLGLMTVAAASMRAMPPTTGPQYWTTDPNLDCSSMHSLIIEVQLASGGKGYSCLVMGSFVWMAAGGAWSTSIRTTAPSSGAIGVDFGFWQDGQRITMDTTSGNEAVPASGNLLSLALNPNQPSEIRLLGATSSAPQYATTQTGFVYAVFYCPDAVTCSTVLSQLLFSFEPIKPWSFSLPILWDTTYSSFQPKGIWSGWSASGLSDATHLISSVIYNQSRTAATFTVRVFDNHGSLVGQATTPSIPVLSTLGFVLSDLIRTPLPSGILKVTVDGGSNVSSVAFFQFDGNTATSLQAIPELPG